MSHAHESRPVTARCAVVTLSDTRTPETDKSGQHARDLLESAGHAVAHYEVIKDDPAALDAVLTALLSRPDLDLVITNGGTGVSRRDNTVPVIERHLAIPLPGFGELFRSLSYADIGSAAMLSRALGGVAGADRRHLLFALPGSTQAVDLGMRKLILPEIGHLLSELRKDPN